MDRLQHGVRDLRGWVLFHVGNLHRPRARRQRPWNHVCWLEVRGGSTRRELFCGCVGMGLCRKRNGLRPVTWLGAEDVGDGSPAPPDPASCNARGTSESDSKDCCGGQFGGCEHGAALSVHPTPSAARSLGGAAADTPLRRARSDARFGIDGYFAQAWCISFSVADEGSLRAWRVRRLVEDAAEFEPFCFGSGCAGCAPAAASATARRAIARALAKSLWWDAPQCEQVHVRILRPWRPRGPVSSPQSKQRHVVNASCTSTTWRGDEQRAALSLSRSTNSAGAF